jgi:hypothetical protein
MGEYEHGDLSEDGGDDSDDIARFERQCAARARAEGLPQLQDEEEDALSDDNPVHARLDVHRRPAASPQNKGSDGEWQRRCSELQSKLSRREAELSQVKGDLELLGKEASSGSGDAVAELKQRLLDISKKHRRAQVTAETQKSRIQQLEAELRKPREEAKRQAEEVAAQQYGAILGDGEDFKKKYLQASNKLQESRHETHELRTEMHRQKKVLIKELGSEDSLEKALAAADDPGAAGWKGRAAQISQLQRQLRDFKEQLKEHPGCSEADADVSTPQRAQPRRSAPVADKDRAAVDKAAEKRREEFEKLQEEVERLRSEQGETKRKCDGLKSRKNMLESQVKELKVHVITLVEKSENDDALVSALQRQLGRQGPSMDLQDISEDTERLENLRLENEELQAQLERQAQIVLQLQQKNIAAACESGSARLGPRSVDPGTPTSALSDRVRFLEADNAKQQEHVKMLQKQLGQEDTGPGRPFSAESSLDLKDRLRHMGDRLASAERENLDLRRRVEDQRPGSSASCRSNSAGNRALGPDMEQLLRQNEALKREVAGLRRASGGSRDRLGSPCSSLGGDR